MARRWPTGGGGALALAVLLAALGSARATHAEEEPLVHVAKARRIARDVQPAIVRIQWRARDDDAAIVERHAVVIDSDGWLLLAGPLPGDEGTFAAIFEDGRAMRASVWGTDPTTCLTLLRVPAVRLPPLSLRRDEDPIPSRDPEIVEAGAPSNLPAVPCRVAAGFPFVMVTAGRRGEGPASAARGRIRASHRRRLVEEPGARGPTEVTCLDESALAVLPADLGAPWLDAEGRIVGLLVGADVGAPGNGRTRDGVAFRPEVTAAYAVPADVIRVVWPLLKVHRDVARPALGALVARLSDATRDHVCAGCGGWEVLDLAPGGPAQLAQVELQDILLEVNGRRLAPAADLADVLLPHRPGERVRLGLLRRGEPIELEIVLGRAR